jgi:gluconokinase
MGAMISVARPFAVILMGVSGSGKTAVGERLAERLRVPFFEGDDFHPKANVEKMSSGVPLDDDDRWPWLDAIAAAIKKSTEPVLIVSCSALKRAYRERLSAGTGRSLVFVFLDASRETLAARLEGRHHHFMPAALLDSQLRTLEGPAPGENAIRVSVEPPLDEVVDSVASALAEVASRR